MAVRLVVAEDSLLVREGIVKLLDAHADVEIVALCVDLPELLDAVERLVPDVVLTDIRMPPSGTDEGIRAATELRQRHPEVGVVVLSQSASGPVVRVTTESNLRIMSDAAMTIERVGVVGCGLMGSGIAEVCARAGLDVMIGEISAEVAEVGRERLVKSLDRGLSAGKMTEEERDAAVTRLSFTTDLADFADRDLVVEAVVENEAMKVEIFKELDRVMTVDGAILASNTSSIPIMKLGTATRRPEQVIGIHFFNPVPVLRLVELVTSLMTSEDTTARSAAFATDVLHKRVIHSKDRAGFVVNALLIPYLLSAIRMMESGFASAEDIDTGMVEGCSHPMGPLRLTDLIGLDTTLAVAESLYSEFKEPLYAAPPLLSRMVDAGLLGRKSGRGFYDYSR